MDTKILFFSGQPGSVKIARMANKKSFDPWLSYVTPGRGTCEYYKETGKQRLTAD